MLSFFFVLTFFFWVTVGDLAERKRKLHEIDHVVLDMTEELDDRVFLFHVIVWG
jgi:hypothetical protein